MLPVISEVATHKNHSLKIFKFPKKSEAANGSVLWRLLFLKVSLISLENACVGGFFNKVTNLRPVTLLLKKDSSTGVFLRWDVQNF